MVFVGGDAYAEIESQLWLFAVLGTVLALLQLVVYSVLARQGTRSTYLVWVGVRRPGRRLLDCRLACEALVVTVTVVDGLLLAALMAVSLWRLRELAPEPASPGARQPRPAQ